MFDPMMLKKRIFIEFSEIVVIFKIVSPILAPPYPRGP
jgi:hypothetical protein